MDVGCSARFPRGALLDLCDCFWSSLQNIPHTQHRLSGQNVTSHLKHECESGVEAVNRNGSHQAVRWDNHCFCASACPFVFVGLQCAVSALSLA